MDVRDLRRRVAGRVTHRDDAGYEGLCHELVWNGRKPGRRPELIVRAGGEADVVEAVRFARAAGLKVSIRGGGHNWSGFSQRTGGLLLDLSTLVGVAVDVGAGTAEVEPGVQSRAFNRRLAAMGLAFPVGHCATVPMSGFLLNGGLGWNSNAWRPGCFGIESARVVTADGEVVVADEKENPDLLWAVRGSGPGFCGVVTRYTLRLQPMPRRITSNAYYYPMSRVDELGAWFDRAVTSLPELVEVSMLMVPAPPDLAAVAEPDNGYVCLLSATAFADTLGEARTAMAVLDESPVLGECLNAERDQLTPIDSLLEPSSTFWPDGWRYLADTAWSDSPAEVLRRARDHYRRAPSRRSFSNTWFSTGAGGIASPHPDAAFSMTGRTLTLCYAIWEDAGQDEPNRLWHRTMMDDLDQLAIGHYIGEAEIVQYPDRHERSFQPEHWRRLQQVRHRFDPDRLFYGPFTEDAAAGPSQMA